MCYLQHSRRTLYVLQQTGLQHTGLPQACMLHHKGVHLKTKASKAYAFMLQTASQVWPKRADGCLANEGIWLNGLKTSHVWIMRRRKSLPLSWVPDPQTESEDEGWRLWRDWRQWCWRWRLWRRRLKSMMKEVEVNDEEGCRLWRRRRLDEELH